MAFTSEPESLSCINCPSEKMEKVQCEKTITIDRCPRCGGIWLDKGELIDLFTVSDFYIKHLDTSEQKTVEMKEGNRQCPRCRIALQHMKNNKAPEVNIDRCPTCKGVWLDRGELTKLAKLYAR
ncbi:MAG: zf-TFIIB domain-containing protein [Spirochaetales bacterium]|nr:zf-TFIIB domain-containing protein [Spirochaetales bacterium]